MHITDEELKRIEHYADKKHDASTMLLVQVLQELRELKKLFNESQNSGNSSDDSTNSAEKGKY